MHRSHNGVSAPALPDFFRPLFWSYDFAKIEPERDKKTIIIQSLNYGNLDHWRWLIKFYGKQQIAKVLETVPVTEVKPRTRKLAMLMFPIKDFNYAPRSAH